jgi:hypothetical protein
MAQIWRVRLGGVPLGAVEPQHVNAVGALTNGLVGLTGVVLLARKHQAGAYVLMIAAAVVGATIGAAKAFSGPPAAK